MSSFLILVNNAPKMAPYHRHLGDTLVKQGHTVIYAYSDRLPLLIDNVPEDNTYIFSTYFRDNFNNAVVADKYKHLNLWEALYSDFDRNIVNYRFKAEDYNYYNALIANLVSFYDKIFTEHKIDHFIYENISNSFAHFCFEVAKINNVGFIGYCVSRMPGRFELQNEIYNIVERFSKAYDNTDLADVDSNVLAEIDAYMDRYKNSIPTYHSLSHPLSYKYSLYKKYLNNDKVKMLRGAFQLNMKYGSEVKYSYQLHNPLRLYSSFFLRQVNRKIKVATSGGMFDKVDLNDKFFMFPLQMKPESSTSVWAKHFVDEITLIKNIAFNLPYGTKLYIKEHFVNLGNLPKYVYRELKKIPNIKMIHPLEQNKPLLDNCLGLITLTSTMGFEALMMGKTVVAFGDIFYKKHPNCISVKSFEGLFDILSGLSATPDPDTEVNRHFLAAYYKCTYEGNINFVSYPEYDPERFTLPMVSAIDKMLNEKAVQPRVQVLEQN